MEIGGRYMVERNGELHEAEILDTRLSTTDIKQVYEYFVRYPSMNRRSDEWVALDKFNTSKHANEIIIPIPASRTQDSSIDTMNRTLNRNIENKQDVHNKQSLDRSLVTMRHLQSQSNEQCPNFPNCIELETEKLLIIRAKSMVNNYNNPKSSLEKPNLDNSRKQIEIPIIGFRRPSQQLMLALNVLNSRSEKSSQNQISFTVLDNPAQIDTSKFRQMSTDQIGCFCIFTNYRSFEHVSQCLDYLFSQPTNSSLKDKKFFNRIPLVLLYAADISLDGSEMIFFEGEGQRLADTYDVPFINVTAIDQYRQHQKNSLVHSDYEGTHTISECASLDYTCVDGAFNVLKEAISRHVCFAELYTNQSLIPRQAFNPDLRILMCLLCGEPFPVTDLLNRIILDRNECYVLSPTSICFKAKLDGSSEKFIEIIISSYTHGALSHREELLHGFILVCSASRAASLTVLNSFSSLIPCSPVLILSVSDSRNTTDLVEDAKSTARRLSGHFELVNLKENKPKQNFTCIEPFLKSVFKKKITIEQAFELGDKLPPSTQQTVQENPIQTSESTLGTKITPGKLDLSQFDNITNAIKKLNIHPNTVNSISNNNNKMPLILDKKTKSSDSNKSDSPPDKSTSKVTKVKKLKVKTKETLNKTSSSKNIELPSSLQQSKKLHDFELDDKEVDLANPADNKEDNFIQEKISGISRAPRVNVRPTKFLNSTAASGTSTFSDVSNVRQEQTTSELNNNLIGKKPKPAPRSVALTSSNPSYKPISNSPLFSNSSNKRIASVRQNHGIAVAPPQLPQNSSFIGSYNEGIDQIENMNGLDILAGRKSDYMKIQKDYDFTQSPITQKLLKNSTNHKVSELSSPLGSKVELTAFSPLESDILMSKGSNLFLGESSARSNSIDSGDLLSSRDATIRQLNELLAHKPPSMVRQHTTIGTCSDHRADERVVNVKKDEVEDKKSKKLAREVEKRRLKEEERQRRAEKKLEGKKSKTVDKVNSILDDDGVPIFVKKCIEFIEKEGLDAEGIYRVPGNRAQVDAFVHKFEENPQKCILESDVPVNAVATALKDFFSKKAGPIMPIDLMNELVDLSSVSNEHDKIEAIRELMHKMPRGNYRLMRFMVGHFVNVTRHYTLNSMDSKNLAICWWPTLLPLHFSDMIMFETMRPHLESSVQMMIDHFDIIFDTEDPTQTVSF